MELFDRFGNEIKIGSVVTYGIREGNSGGVSDGVVVGFGVRKGSEWKDGKSYPVTYPTIKVKPCDTSGRMRALPVRTVGTWKDRMTVVIIPTAANQHEMGS